MAQNETTQGWTPQVNGRGTLDIICACVLTIFLCCWTSVCVNVPSLKGKRFDHFREKLFVACIGILGPEFLILLAMGQWESARRSVKKFNAAELSKKKWTMRQAFFADMGGYLLRAVDYEDPFPIHAEQLYFLVSEGYFGCPTIDEADIDDKNKRDGLARLLTVLQALIFGASTIARFSQHLAITTLEITTLAFIFADVGTSFFWKHKPQGITRPVILDSKIPVADILVKAGITSPEDYTHTPLDFLNPEPWFCSVYWMHEVRTYKRLLRFWFVKISKARPVDRLRSDNFPALSMPHMVICAFCFVILYSAIFLGAWNTYFPSRTERILWRVASVMTLGYAFFGGAFFFYIDLNIIRKKDKKEPAGPTGKTLGRPNLPHHRTTVLRRTPSTLTREPAPPMALQVALCNALYIVARAYVLIENVIGLRSLPVSAFATVDWTQYLPHN